MNDMIPYACTDRQRGSGEKLGRYFCGNEGLMTCPKERGRADGVKFFGGVAGAYRFPAYDRPAYDVGLMKVG